MKVFDFENHFYEPRYLDVISNREEVPSYDPEEQVMTWIKNGEDVVTCPQGPLLNRLIGINEQRVADMDKYDIETSVLSPAPGIEFIQDSSAIDLARAHNDYTAEMIAKYPGRFLGTAALPVYDVDAAIKEIERCVKDLGFVGWHTHSNYVNNGYIDDVRYKPLLKKCAELGAYIYIHPTVPLMNRYYRYGYSFCGAGLGFTVDAATTTIALICSGIFDECEGLQVLMGHLGEAIPFLLQRMDWGLGSPRAVLCNQKRKISDYFKENIMVTTSGNTEKEAFELTKEILGIDRILVGTDFPFGGDNCGGIGEMMEFLNSLDLIEEERKALYYLNGEKLTGHTI